MSDLKICNLDVIAPIQPRQLVVGGKEYAVEPLTTARFVELNQSRQSLAKIDSIEESLKAMIVLIRKFIPKIPEKTLEMMSIQQLQLTLAFVADEIPESVLNKDNASEVASDKVAENTAGK